MIIKTSEFVASYQNEKSCPQTGLPEFAFIGRSNVGKSSLINMICEKKGLAKTSQTPGKTQTLNFFTINEDNWYLVDLPGYGYARTSKTTRAGFSKMIDEYFSTRKSLACAFVLIDGMIPPQKIDIEFVNFLGKKQVPFVLAFTKTDRVKPLELTRNVNAFQAKLAETFATMPNHFITSGEKKTGKEDILDFIKTVLDDIK